MVHGPAHVSVLTRWPAPLRGVGPTVGQRAPIGRDVPAEEKSLLVLATATNAKPSCYVHPLGGWSLCKGHGLHPTIVRLRWIPEFLERLPEAAPA